MSISHHKVAVAAAFTFSLTLFACGTGDTETAADEPDTTEDTITNGAEEVDDDSSDTDGADEDRGSEDEDHGSEDDHDGEGAAEDHDSGDDHDGGDDHDSADGDHDDHDDEIEGGLGAHEHGAAELSVAWSGGDMVVDLISPTFNIFGFEYEPTTVEDTAIADDRTAALTAPGIMVVNPEADCSQSGDAETELEFEGSHAEITVSWLLTCENPAEIRQLDATALFDEFPSLEDLDAQWASESGQSSAELTPAAPILDLG